MSRELALGAEASETASATLTERALSRLGSDWLGWSAQLGSVPERVVLVTPDLTGTVVDGPTAARVLNRALPEATVDAIQDEDPVGLTLRRLAEAFEDGKLPAPAGDDGRRAMVALSNRPGRRHRSMYLWASVAMGVASVAVGVGAWRAQQGISGLRERAEAIEAETDEIVGLVDPGLVDNAFVVARLRERIRNEQAERVTPGVISEPLPIFQELSELSWIIGVPDFTLGSLSMDEFAVRFELRVKNLQDLEAVRQAVRELEEYGSVNWNLPQLTEQSGGEILMTFIGRWKDGVRRGRGA